MRLSDAGLHRRRTKKVYPHHPFPPWLTEDVTRDRSNRLLDGNPDHLGPRYRSNGAGRKWQRFILVDVPIKNRSV
jgi:hypothetical protein